MLIDLLSNLKWMWDCNICRSDCIFFLHLVQVWMELWCLKQFNFCDAGDAIFLLQCNRDRMPVLNALSLNTSYVAVTRAYA